VRLWRALGPAVGLTVVTAACSGGAGSYVTSSATTVRVPDAPTSTAPTAPATTAARAAETSHEVPAFIDDFARVCTTQVGYSGATPYDQTPSVHPVAVFESDDQHRSYTESLHTLPAGWTLTPGPASTDKAQLATVQLIACIDRTATSPAGIDCNFDSDGTPVTLALVNATYDVTLYVATTGAKLGDVSVDAKTSECPYVAAYRDGDTQYVTALTDDEVTNAVKPYVMPGG
jgi:hypothetical protein